MDLRTINLNKTVESETFGGEGFGSGRYQIEITKTEKAIGEDGTCSLNFEIMINGTKKYIQMYLVSKNKDGKLYDNTTNINRFGHLLCFLKINPQTLTEVNTNQTWLKDIPQVKGVVNSVIEVIPAKSCKPNKDGNQYPKMVFTSFFDGNTGKTIKELKSGAINAEEIEKQVLKLSEKAYKEYKIPNTQNTPRNNTQSTPNAFNVDNDNLNYDDLPF